MKKRVSFLIFFCLLMCWNVVNAGKKTVKLTQNVKPAVVLIQTFDVESKPIGQGI